MYKRKHAIGSFRARFATIKIETTSVLFSNKQITQSSQLISMSLSQRYCDLYVQRKLRHRLVPYNKNGYHQCFIFKQRTHLFQLISIHVCAMHCHKCIVAYMFATVKNEWLKCIFYHFYSHSHFDKYVTFLVTNSTDMAILDRDLVI